MSSLTSELAYAAHTKSAIFYLDAEGVCRSVAPSSPGAGPVSPELSRCVGAQYVAALDVASPGGLLGVPQPGSDLLFVVADARMHFSLLRTAPLVRFEAIASQERRDAASTDGASDVSEAVSEAVEQAIALASMFEVKVTWPSAAEIARQLPLASTARRGISRTFRSMAS
jgi:hypothetical protein